MYIILLFVLMDIKPSISYVRDEIQKLLLDVIKNFVVMIPK